MMKENLPNNFFINVMKCKWDIMSQHDYFRKRIVYIFSQIIFFHMNEFWNFFLKNMLQKMFIVVQVHYMFFSSSF
jgi:hypothetical protein